MTKKYTIKVLNVDVQDKQYILNLLKNMGYLDSTYIQEHDIK